MKGVIRSFKRMRMSPVERVVDHLRFGEFKEAGKVAKKGISNFDGKDLAENVLDKLAHLDSKQRKVFFDELAESPEKIKHMLYDSKEFNRAKDRVEDILDEHDLKCDLFRALGVLVLFCAIFKWMRNK